MLITRVKLNSLIPFNQCGYEVFLKGYFRIWWDIQIKSFPTKTAYEVFTKGYFIIYWDIKKPTIEKQNGFYLLYLLMVIILQEATLLKSTAWRLIANIILIKGCSGIFAL